MSKRVKKNYELNQSVLYKCNSKKKLFKILKIEGYTYRTLKSVITYKQFPVSKGNSSREINAPDPELKEIQKNIDKCLKHVKRAEWLFSSEINKSFVKNGKYHLDNKIFLTVDIKNFFDCCQREYVYQFFLKALQTSKDVAEILTDLTTLDNKIPTGCPTSQIIAYYAYEKMFYEIAFEAKKLGFKFSLYVDDMTFSCDQNNDVSELQKRIDIILRKYEHKPKYKKVKKYFSKDNKPITGTIIKSNSEEKKLFVPNKQRMAIKNLFFILKSSEELNDNEVNRVKIAQQISGKIYSARQMEEAVFPQILIYCKLILSPYYLQMQYTNLLNSPKSNEEKKKSAQNILKKMDFLKKNDLKVSPESAKRMAQKQFPKIKKYCESILE